MMFESRLFIERCSAHFLAPFSTKLVLLLIGSDLYTTFAVFKDKMEAECCPRHDWLLTAIEKLFQLPFL